MTRPAEIVVPLLDGVRKVRPMEWVAKCPAHADRHPSLAVRETDDGNLLMHCFAECPISEVLSAVGLDVGDLFAAPLENKSSIRHPFSPAAVLKAIKNEATIVAIAGADAADGNLADEDRTRLLIAVSRIEEAVRYA